MFPTLMEITFFKMFQQEEKDENMIFVSWQTSLQIFLKANFN